MGIEQKLQEQQIILPVVAAPVGAYVPAVRSGRHVFTSGQLPLVEGKLRYTGKVGQDITIEDGYQAARICVLNALAAVKKELGSLDNVVRVVKVTGFVNSTPEFTDQPKVLNGASELLGSIFSEGHARSAVGVAALPLNAAVEVEIIVEITD